MAPYVCFFFTDDGSWRLGFRFLASDFWFLFNI